MPTDDPIAVDLTADERTLLVYGLLDWGGPATPTNSIAVALGFTDADDLTTTGGAIAQTIRASQPLHERDWTRALASAEVILTSSLMGTGDEWTVIHAQTDTHWFATLRQLQAKLPTDPRHLGQ